MARTAFRFKEMINHRPQGNDKDREIGNEKKAKATSNGHHHAPRDLDGFSFIRNQAFYFLVDDMRKKEIK